MERSSSVGKVFGGRIVEGDLFAVHHFCQYQRSKDLGDGSDFEDGISIERSWIAVGEVAISDNAAAGRFDDTHDNAHRLLLLIDVSYEDLADLVCAKASKWLKDIRIHDFQKFTPCPKKKTKGHFRRHTPAVTPNFVERVGLARRGGKQVVLTRADHRFKRIEFVSHNRLTSFT